MIQIWFRFMLLLLISKSRSTSAKIIDHFEFFELDRQYASMPALFHFDDYDRCVLHGDDFLYCNVLIELYPLNFENTSYIWNIIEEVSSNPKNYRHDLLRYGICISEILNTIKNRQQITQELHSIYNNKYNHEGIGLKVINMKCESKQPSYPVDLYDIIYLILIISYAMFVFFATFYEQFAPYQNKYYKNSSAITFKKILSSFSLTKNWFRLTKINLKDRDVKALRSIQGVRFYNMVIVIIGHTIAMNFAIPVSNPLYLESITESFWSIFLDSGKHITQTFFLISSWLLTYNFFMILDKMGRLKPKYLILAFVYRYIRLTPTLAIMIAFHSTLLIQISRGPFWNDFVGKEYEFCRENWWINLLYLNNYINKKRMCFPQTWYMAVDTQFYICSLFILSFMWNYQNKIKYILGSIFMSHITMTFFIVFRKNYNSSEIHRPEIYYNRQIMELDQWHMFYSSSFANFPGLIAGLFYGYIFYKYRNQMLFTKQIHVLLWWIAIWSLSLGIIFLPKFIHQPSNLFNAIYGSLDRSVFVFSIGFGIFGVTQGTGSVIKWICEWPPTYILGRLTYSAYLFHTFVLRLQAGTKRSPNYLATHKILVESAGNITISYIGGLLLTLFVEMPISKLQKHLASSLADVRDT